MDTEAPLNTSHDFYVTMRGGVRGTVTIIAAPDGEVVRVINGALLGVVTPPSAVTSGTLPGTRVAGVRQIKNSDGSITPVPSEKVKTDIRLFVETTPCWFPECEALRTAYNAELASLPADCPSCEKGALIRKYLKKMETLNTDAS